VRSEAALADRTDLLELDRAPARTTAERWGMRHGREGKVIRAEQRLPAEGPDRYGQ
jgi:hypothetical protein